eukprot:scaffold150384_cov19-Prasinocladus_malaysianus.AAC.1
MMKPAAEVARVSAVYGTVMHPPGLNSYSYSYSSGHGTGTRYQRNSDMQPGRAAGTQGGFISAHRLIQQGAVPYVVRVP